MKKHHDFPGQRSDEKLILLVRRHWTKLLKDFIKFIFLLLIPIAIIIVVFLVLGLTFESEIIYTIIVFAVSLYLLFIMLFFLNDFVDHQLDLWIVTDQRIINMEQEGLFNRVISSQSIERVQDVTSEVKGKVATFLDYGNVYIQTAGEEQRFVFEEVPHPAQIVKIIQDVHDRVEEDDEKEDRDALVKALKEGGINPKAIMKNKPQDLTSEPPKIPNPKPRYNRTTLKDLNDNDEEFL